MEKTRYPYQTDQALHGPIGCIFLVDSQTNANAAQPYVNWASKRTHFDD